MTVIITAVPKESIGEVWPIVSPMLDAAIKRTNGRWHNVDVMMEILKGTASLWIAINPQRDIIGAMVLTICSYPGGIMAGRIDYVGGRNREEWFDQIWNTAARYCKEEGCDTLEGVCRPGIVPYVVGRYGAKNSGTFFELDLRKERNHG